jgi:hypothetical protein
MFFKIEDLTHSLTSIKSNAKVSPMKHLILLLIVSCTLFSCTKIINKTEYIQLEQNNSLLISADIRGTEGSQLTFKSWEDINAIYSVTNTGDQEISWSQGSPGEPVFFALYPGHYNFDAYVELMEFPLAVFISTIDDTLAYYVQRSPLTLMVYGDLPAETTLAVQEKVSNFTVDETGTSLGALSTGNYTLAMFPYITFENTESLGMKIFYFTVTD